MDDWGAIPGEGNEGVFHHCIQTGSGAHPCSYAMSTEGSYTGSKPARM